MPKEKNDSSISDLLRSKGFRATTNRVKLLSLLAELGKPLSVQSILANWKDNAPDQTTLYRSLTDLSQAGVVRRVDLNTGIAHFEYTPTRPHHHHIICTNCGDVEEVNSCPLHSLNEKLLQETSRFKEINTHNLEFFGQCAKCTKK